MLKLDNEDDEDEQETVERLKDLSATYQWYQVKEDGSEVIIPDAAKADLKLNTNDFPGRTDAYKLIRRITWKEDNEEFTNTSTIDQLVILKVNPKTEEAHKHKLKKIEAKKASVDADGNVEYYICESCGRFFADKNGHRPRPLPRPPQHRPGQSPLPQQLLHLPNRSPRLIPLPRHKPQSRSRSHPSLSQRPPPQGATAAFGIG